MRKIWIFTLTLCLWLAADPVAAAWISFGEKKACRSEAEDELRKLGLGPDDVKKMSIVTLRKSGRGTQVVQGHQVWVALVSCSGDLVIELRPHCTLKQAYTRGDCRVPGVKSY